MPNGRSAAQKEAHNTVITDALILCRPLAQVAKELRVSRDTVKRAVRTLTERWRAETSEQIGSMKARDLAALDRMQWEAWQGWQRSIGRKIKRRVMNSKENGRTTFREITHDAGDHKFLDVILKCVEKRGQIAGYIERGEEAAPPQDIVIQIGQQLTLNAGSAAPVNGNGTNGTSHPA